MSSDQSTSASLMNHAPAFLVGLVLGALLLGAVVYGPGLWERTPMSRPAASTADPKDQARIDAALTAEYPELYADGVVIRQWSTAALNEVRHFALRGGWSLDDVVALDVNSSRSYEDGRHSIGIRLYSPDTERLARLAKEIPGKRRLRTEDKDVDVVFRIDRSEMTDQNITVEAFEPRWY